MKELNISIGAINRYFRKLIQLGMIEFVVKLTQSSPNIYKLTKYGMIIAEEL